MKYDGKLFQFVLFFCRMAALNILWAVCCVPMLTAGPATAALYYALWKLRTGEDGHIFRKYWRQFCSNLWYGIPMTGIMAVLALICIYFVLSFLGAFKIPLLFRILLGAYTLLYLLVSGVAWPLLGHFQNTLGGYFSSAVSIVFRNLPVALLATTVELIPLLLCWVLSDRWLVVILAYMLVGRSCTALLNDTVLLRIFERYTTAGTGT